MKKLSIAVLVALVGVFASTSYADVHNYNSASSGGGSMSTGSKATGSKATYEAAHAAAVASANKAKKVGGEWRDIRWKKSKAVKVKTGGKTKKMGYLPAAEAYAAMGDYAKATKYANLVEFQGKMGYEQAMEQKGAGPRL